MKKVYGYIRVSTVKQGTGVSLQEQKEAIVRYADKHNLEIIEWFEEQETAAKQGRPLFNKMMKLVKAGKSNGVIIHKIDRSARNLKDWALLGDFIDQGFEIHFAHESLDMETRGGRLAADIQAVIASDYIRNLRDEAIKGLYGRLKQGYYPFYAPIGYINTGKGQVKTIDKVKGPLIQKAFELYGSEKYNLKNLVNVMFEFGLRNKKGNKIGITAMALILHNPFYTGIMKIKGKTFQGNHEPLITSKLFLKVQNTLKGKTNARKIKHEFLFRKMMKCKLCSYLLIGETRKGHIYYRCQIKNCKTKSIREDLVLNLLQETLKQIKFSALENNILDELLVEAQTDWLKTQNGLQESIQMQKNQLTLQFERLTDAFLENILDKSQYQAKKEQLMIRQQELINSHFNVDKSKEAIFKKASNFLGLIKNFMNSFIMASNEEKRKLLKCITSDFGLQEKKLIFTMNSPFKEIANRANLLSGELNRIVPRTKIADLAICFCEQSTLLNKNTHLCACTNTNTIKEILPLNSLSEKSQNNYKNHPEITKQMKELLNLILTFCQSDDLDTIPEINS